MNIFQQIKADLEVYHKKRQEEMDDFNRHWPHRIDLKLPLDEDLRKIRLNEMYRWFKDTAADYVPGPTVPFETRGFTHMTVWFKRQDLATYCKLTWSGA